MSIVTEITSAFLDTISAIFAEIGTGLVTVFETVIYDPTTGLTSLAQWMIVFMGVSFALTVFYMIARKVL